MTRDEILRLWYSIETRTIDDHIECFARLVAEKERAKYVQWPQLETWDSQKDRQEGA